MEKVTLHSSASEVIADPHAFLRAVREAVPDFDAAAAAALADAAAEEEMLGDMATFDSEVTGIHNTIFVSTKIGVRHGPRIKVAINPPTHFRPDGDNVTVTFQGAAIPADAVPAALLWQLQEFINQNRAALLDYWECRISTNELQRQLKRIGS